MAGPNHSTDGSNAMAVAPIPYSWKDDEFGYCLNLIRTRGNADVGREE
jgi:hypothetical protein